MIKDFYTLPERLWTRGRNVFAALALAGWAGCALAWRTDPTRFAASYLVGYVFFLTLALGALFFVVLQHLTGAAWSVTMRRMAENLTNTLPAAAVLFLPVAFSLGSLYEWARPEAVAADPILQGKAAFLNPQFFLIRAGVYFAIWSFWALKLYRNSTSQDEAPSLAAARSSERWSAPGMLALTLTVALASFDWLMSLDPHWYSTMFGIYIYSGAALAFTAALTLVLLAFRGADVLRYSVNREHYHDLGKWIFGLTIFWAYIAFSQYMLIWYANLPEETVWFRDRLAGSWRPVAALLVVGHFIAPFLVLVSRAAKRRLGVLAAAAAWILLMHYTDLYWIVMPVFSKKGFTPSWIDLAALAAVGGSLGLVFWWRLRSHALAPTGDIRFEKSLEFTNVF
jgi:hypothetical protein